MLICPVYTRLFRFARYFLHRTFNAASARRLSIRLSSSRDSAFHARCPPLSFPFPLFFSLREPGRGSRRVRNAGRSAQEPRAFSFASFDKICREIPDERIFNRFRELSPLRQIYFRRLCPRSNGFNELKIHLPAMQLGEGSDRITWRV